MSRIFFKLKSDVGYHLKNVSVQFIIIGQKKIIITDDSITPT